MNFRLSKTDAGARLQARLRSGPAMSAGAVLQRAIRRHDKEFGAHADPPAHRTSLGHVGHANNFDLLRLIFAIMVILSHSFILIDGNNNRDPLTFFFHGITLGEFAVDGFFLLSGYLIVQSWSMRPDPIVFMRKRILRIYPGFIVAALISALVVGPLGADAAQYFSELKIGQFLKSMLLLKVPAVPPAFNTLPYPTVNGSMWTIFFEFTCYTAVLLLGVTGAIRARRAWLAITLLIFLIGVVHKTTHLFPEENFYLPIIRFSNFFFAGGCFFLYPEKIKFKPWMAVLCGMLLLFAISHKDMPELLMALAGGYLLFYAAFYPSQALAHFRSCPDVSYGVYLYGWPVQKLLLWYVPSISSWILFPLSCALALVLGFMSWHLIESPFMEMKPLLGRWKKTGFGYE
ncbi:acyltransferase [Herbaspirillum sp. HC18]|nr:acyltransferase [Herbaspirillum sp. HC18]